MSSDNRSPVSLSLFDFGTAEDLSAIADSIDPTIAQRRQARREAKKAAKVQLQPATPAARAHSMKAAPTAAVKHYLTVQELATRWGVGVSTIWRWANEARIPLPVAIGPRATRWEISAIESYERDRREVSR